MSKNQFLKISVVTITLNRRDFLKKAIESVLAQKYSNFEHIVIDAGSTDGTIELLRSYPHIKWLSEPDKGQANAMNKGLKLIDGDIFAWLNSDDTYIENTFKTVNDFFHLNPKVGMIHGLTYFVNRFGEIIGKDNFKSFKASRLAMGFNNINTPTIFIKRSIINKAGYFNENLKATYDVDMYLRISKITKIQSVAYRFGNFCLHSSSGIVSEKNHLKEIPLLRKKYWEPKKFSEVLIFPFLKLRLFLYHKIKYSKFLDRI